MKKSLKILSQHTDFQEAIKAARFVREGYDLRNPGSKQFFVVEPYTNTARIYKDPAEILYVYEWDIKLLNHFDLISVIDDIPFQLARVDNGVINIGSLGFYPNEKALSKSRESRKWIARMQKQFPDIYATTV